MLVDALTPQATRHSRSRLLELGLWERHRVPVVRRTLAELGAAAADGGARLAPDGALVVDAAERGLDPRPVPRDELRRPPPGPLKKLPYREPDFQTLRVAWGRPDFQR